MGIIQIRLLIFTPQRTIQTFQEGFLDFSEKLFQSQIWIVTENLHEELAESTPFRMVTRCATAFTSEKNYLLCLLMWKFDRCPVETYVSVRSCGSVAR